MAPEVLAHQRYSEKADVYSFGIVLWECTARQVSTAGVTQHHAPAVSGRALQKAWRQHVQSLLSCCAEGNT